MMRNIRNQNECMAAVMFCKIIHNSDGCSDYDYQDDYSDGEQPKKITSQLYLLSKSIEFPIFEVMPKLFSISTNNNVCHFNFRMLQEVSQTISTFHLDHPNEMHYHLNISDDTNALSKFEKLFQGQTVHFEENDIPSSEVITSNLLIENCPNFLKPRSLASDTEYDINCKIISNDEEYYDYSFEVALNQKMFAMFLKNSEFLTFNIKTRRNEYQCNIYGVLSSNVIHQILEKDWNVTEFVYDYEDEFGEFQLICDLFNFNQVNMVYDNMYSLKEMANDLQINCIIDNIENFIDNNEKFALKVDEQQEIIESYDNLFGLLYNIKKLGVSEVKFSLMKSKWIHTEEDIKELTAFILQIVKSSFNFQKDMVELLIQLNYESDESNKLDILIPFIVKYLLTFYMPNNRISKYEREYFGYTNGFETNYYNEENRFIFSFIRILYKNKIISKKEIIRKFKHDGYNNINFVAFFLPEIIENDAYFYKKITKIFQHSADQNQQNLIEFILKYLPDKIDLYQKMLDNLEPDDELTKSLIHDDVDKLQFIIIKNNLEISITTVPYNIFDDFDDNPTIINCAALYGSIKCFKYLFLNNGNIDQSTLYFAVAGGNDEIIKIVDQEYLKKNDDDDDDDLTINDNCNYKLKITIDNDNSVKFKKTKIINGGNRYFIDYTNDYNIIYSTIAMHRNDLFDWILEKRFISKGKVGKALENLAIISASCGNIHSLIEIIDKGYDVSKQLISFSAKYGFCKLSQFLLNILDSKGGKIRFEHKSLMQFGNLSILKLLEKRMDQLNFEEFIAYSIYMNYKTIINYFFNKENYELRNNFIIVSLTSSFKQNNDELTTYLTEKYKIYPDFFEESFDLFLQLLYGACFYSNLKATK